MWELKNTTPYAAERGWIRDINGEEQWVVAVKCTYDILPTGEVKLSKTQLPVNSGPIIDFNTHDLIYETDLGAEKRYVDVVLNGHAWSHNKEPVEKLVIGFKVGSLVRLANVYGNRMQKTPHVIAPFCKMKLSYQNMSAGSCKEGNFYNPVGLSKLSERLPNINFLTQNDSDLGLGAVAPHWVMRAKFAGTYDEKWESSRYPLLPEDFNPLFWQIAPESQQLKTRLQGGEKVILANLTPPSWSSQNVVSFYLPRVSLIFDTYFNNGSSQQHRPQIYTLILEPDYPRFSVVWHSVLRCHRDVNALQFTRVWEKKRIYSTKEKLDTHFSEWEALCL